MKRSTFEIVYIWIISILLLNYSNQMMFSMDQSAVDFDGFDYVISIVMLFAVISINLLLNIKKLIKVDGKLSKLFLFFIICIILVNIFIPTNLQFKDLLIQTIKIIMPYLFYYYFFIKFTKRGFDIYYVKIAVFLTLGLVYLYYDQFKIINISKEDEFSSLNIAYFPLFMLPIIMTFKNINLRFLFLFIIGITVFSSFKRGGLIAFFLSITIYYFVENYYIKVTQNKYKNILLFLIFIGFLYFVFYIYDKTSGGFFMERLQDMQEDEGSGRVEIYKEIFNIIQNTALIPFFIGHGHDAVSHITEQNISAHNDFLETFYDYGIFVFWGYIILHFQLIKNSINLIRKKSKYAPSYAMSYSIFLFLSLVSNVIIYPYFVLLTIYWGMIGGMIKSEKKLKIHANEFRK